MTQTPLTVIGDQTVELRRREGMPSLVVYQGRVVATVKDPLFENLFVNALRLRDSLVYTTFVLDNLSGVSIDTLEANRVLADTK